MRNMIAFAALLERLVFTPSRNAKIALLRRYFATQPDPDRGIGLAAITGELSFTAAKPGLIRELAAARTDPVLFDWSYDYVGDLAETVALIWPAKPVTTDPPSLAEVVETLETAPKAALPGLVAEWLDCADASTRLALLKLITGGLRVGASSRLAKIALAEIGGVDADDVEEVWHGLEPPYRPLFAWLEGRGPKPDPADAPVFRPPMLAHPLEAADLAALAAGGLAGGVEMGWHPGPDCRHRGWPAALFARRRRHLRRVSRNRRRDGFRRGAGWRTAGDPRRRRRPIRRSAAAAEPQSGVRKDDGAVSGRWCGCMTCCSMAPKTCAPCRSTSAATRLEAWIARVAPDRMDLSPLIRFSSLQELMVLRDGARAASIEGLMLKRGDSPYLPGRVKGQWWKWKRDPLTVDAVLMYAQRGHGKRSSFYSDYTFGLWRGDELVPVGKAYFGFTDQELAFLDRWIRNHTTARFGPVREVEKSMVLEVAFDAVQLSNRHKSGVAMRFPRLARIRTDKPAAEADRLETLMALVEDREAAD